MKKEKDISFSPLDSEFIATLSYKEDGEIVSSNALYNKEINEILNLNTKHLKYNRKQSWDSVKKELVSIKKGKPWNIGVLKSFLNKYGSMHKKNKELQDSVVNLEATDRDTARRLLDFLSGVVYSLGGKIVRVSSQA